MITNGDIIRDAYGLLGVTDETESPSADQAALGLRIMNDMIADWQVDILIQYFPQTNLAEESPLPEYAVKGVKNGLAIELATYFGRAVPPAVLAFFSIFWAKQLRDTISGQMTESDLTNLPTAEGQWVPTSIIEG